MTCHVTGDISDDNFTLADGKLVLSPEGAQSLIDEIQQKMNK